MTKKIINIGTSPNKGDGDPLRTAFGKINDNFDELYATDTNTKYHLGDDVQFIDIDPDSGTIVIQSGFDTGMPVYIKGANCSDGGVGGNVVIEAGGPVLPNDGTTGNIELAAQQTTIESNNNMWSFRDDGVLELPLGGSIVDSDGNNILDGLGVDIAAFGEGFSLDNADKIVTNKLYSTNLTQPTQHYRLELDTNGIIILPDQSIINGSTLRGIYGTGEANYTGITIGPDANHREESWVWVDHTGVSIATEYSTDAYTWKFDNSGKLTLPSSESIFDQAGIDSGLNIRSNNTNGTIYLYSYGTDGDGTGAGNIYINPTSIELYSSWNNGGAGEKKWTFGSDGTLNLPESTSPGNAIIQTTSAIDIQVNSNAQVWTFGTDGLLTLPGTGTINNTSGGAPTGTIYTFTLDADGSTSGIDNTNEIWLSATPNAIEVQPGWIITFANSTQVTVATNQVSVTPPHSGQRQITWVGNITLTGSDVWPLTIQSADYSAGGATSLEITSDGTTTWTFTAIGTLNLPDFGTVPESSDGSVGDICRSGDLLYFKTSSGWTTINLAN